MATGRIEVLNDRPCKRQHRRTLSAPKRTKPVRRLRIKRNTNSNLGCGKCNKED